MDPADEAGGEVVYSDEGLSPAMVGKAPEIAVAADRSKQTDLGDDDEDVVFSEALDPQMAFEIFQGKIYSSSQASSQGMKSMASSSDRRNESPLTRLARLQQEVTEVEAQLKTTVAGSGQAFDEPLFQLASTLKTQLTSLMASSTSRIPEHDDLTQLIRRQLDSLDIDGTSKNQTPSEDTGVIYELYGNAHNPTTTVEDRILRLERAIGSMTNSSGSSSSNPPHSLWQRLEEMERLAHTVDATTLEQTALKAKVIRADLEAASKARNKLTATYKKEDSKMIQQLHAQLMDLEGISDYLPALVERMQQLAGLHVQAGTFASRLEALETSARQLESSVSQVEGTMEQLAVNLTDNLKTMEGNLKVLDERLNEL